MISSRQDYWIHYESNEFFVSSKLPGSQSSSLPKTSTFPRLRNSQGFGKTRDEDGSVYIYIYIYRNQGVQQMLVLYNKIDFVFYMIFV